MQAQHVPLAPPAPLIFSEAERPFGERLMKLALETDRVEGYTEPHAVMIARLAETIGRQVGLHGQDLTALKFAALAHDIGERGLKRNYLLQPNALSWEETLDLWRHPILGEQSAAEIQLPRQAQLLIRWHQEWWNGQGYPDGLAGAAIPIGARILRAVDSYCALISQRPYRQRYDLPEAEQMIADLSGIEFDPHVARLLLAVVVAERKQREAEVWSVPPAFESPFAPVADDAVPAPAGLAESELAASVSAADADTLLDFPPADQQHFAPTVESVSPEPQPPAPYVETTGERAADSISEAHQSEIEDAVISPQQETSTTPTATLPATLAELEGPAAPAAPEQLDAIPPPVAQPDEVLIAAPYGDVLVHQAADEESPMPLANDEIPSAKSEEAKEKQGPEQDLPR